LGRKNERKVPKTVQELSVGGARTVTVMTKKGEKITVTGKVVEINGKKHLQENSGWRSFGPGTIVTA